MKLLSSKVPFQAFDVVDRSISASGADRIVVRRIRLQTRNHHAEFRSGMFTIEADVRLGLLVELLWLGSVVRDAKMLVGSPGVRGGPPDDSPVAPDAFNLRPV